MWVLFVFMDCLCFVYLDHHSLLHSPVNCVTIILSVAHVLSIFILTWSSDTFAYLVGRKIGKHRLFERISPKKSWEGFIGGVIFSVIAGLLIAHFTDDSFIKYTIYGVTIATFGTLGDYPLLSDAVIDITLDLIEGIRLLALSTTTDNGLCNLSKTFSHK